MFYKKDRQPLKRGVAKVPVVMQMEALECGAACLAMVMAYYRKWVPLEVVRVDCGVSRDGSNAKNVMLAAKNYGLEAHGYRMELDALRQNATFPCIIHWNFDHFVVLDGFRGGKAILNDPARGVVKLSMEAFDEAFTGVCIMLAPGEGFVPSGRRRSMVEYARSRLKGTGVAVAFVALTTMISHLFGVIDPVMSRVFYDRLLSGKDPGWLNPFITIMALLCVLELAVEWAQRVYSLRIDGKMAVMGSTSYMWKVMRLPMMFFSQRLTGDILQRAQSNESISGTLVNTIAPLALNTVMMLLYMVLMLRYSPFLTLIGLTSVAVNLIVARVMAEKRINLTRVQMRDEGKLASATLAGISMTETIKSAGAETGFFRRWAGYQASVNTQSVKFSRMTTRMGIIPAFIRNVANYMVMFFGVRFAMDGHFTLGMITVFQGFLSCFMDPAQTLIDAGQTIQEMRTEMERVEDVMQYPDDPYVRDTPADADTDFAKLNGQVTLKDVTFGYSPLGKPVVQNFSMTIEPGSKVAIVGSSGSGKSTISKLISGLYQPTSGEVLFDGRPIADIPRAVFTGSVAVVDQDIILFEDTIANNIRMWDKSIADFEVILAARDAQMHDDILRRPGGYQGRLSENGKDLSGGQRQRLEIARVLAQDPSIIILDEATSALDARTEYEVVRAIQDRGITCIVVAHRLSTIRDCDEIVVLDHGVAVERGTHAELMALDGAYTRLVTSE